MSDALRPTSFAAYVGQPNLLERLRILVSAAKSRQEPLGHLLLHGPPGLGKTTLAHVIASEMGTAAHVAMGPGLEKPNDLHGLFTRIGPGDILFIDEVHRLSGILSECLYPALEDGQIVVMLDCRTHSQPITIPLPPFTLIGATTQPEMLEPPLRARFGLPLALEYYATVDLATILTVNAGKLGLSFDPAAIGLLASRSRGTPRIANHLLRFVRDYAAVEGDGRVTVPLAEAALRMQGIDALGLNEQDRQYLRVLTGVYRGGPVGAEALAATMGLKADTVSGMIEPILLQHGLIFRSRQGRRATDAATAHLATIAA